MSNTIPFTFENTSVRVVNRDGEAWFVGADVAKALGYSNPQKAIQAHCKAAENCKSPILGDLGLEALSPRGLILIPERDVYRLVMRSKLPSAEQFEEKVVGEILPSIRKTGGYMANHTIMQQLRQLQQEVASLKSNINISGGHIHYYKSLLDVMIALNVPQKGRRDFIHRCSKRLKEQLQRFGQHDLFIDRCVMGKNIFHVTAIDDWLKREGYDLIHQHINRVNNQKQITIHFSVTGIKYHGTQND